MQSQSSIESIKMSEQSIGDNRDPLVEFLNVSQEKSSDQSLRMHKESCYRSTHDLHHKEAIQRLLNSSSSNGKLPCIIPDSEDSLDRHSQINVQFKKKYEEDMSVEYVEHIVTDSFQSYSEVSDSMSGPILPRMEAQSIKKGCHCRKSQCLKLYCDCFQKKMFCSELCNCKGCGNRVENKKHQQAVIEALARNAHGFQETEENGFSLGVEPGQIKKGCKCKKTGCLKKYCQCYQNGIPCTVFCKCNGCNNC